ncbi:hypothetical protein U9M48_008029 [Paspalum notatum var. saurae]|uniref:F-box domain-containing protein n=1 Tax=Paspalum notatum var. saurae TaxID=547442 RepID=A0AAQ3WCN4_PASNO
MCEDHRRSCPGEDRISSLPDELLHGILVRLRSTRAAGRTSVLSRRWRHVWAHLPELLLVEGDGLDAPSFLDKVDGALAGYSAPTLERLSISLPNRHDLGVSVRRVQPWLCFASERAVGALCLLVPPPISSPIEHVIMWTHRRPEHVVGKRDKAEVLYLPAWKGATKIDLHLQREWRLRPVSAGLFASLTSLTIKGGCVKARELTALVCTQCPRLKQLALDLLLLITSDISLRSDSLQSLQLHIKNTRRLEIVAPRLEELSVDETTKAHISAPNLAKLTWLSDVCDPRQHQFTDVSHRLRLLKISSYSAVAHLTSQFDEVDDLELEVHIPHGTAAYESFLNETTELPKCKTFSIIFCKDYHDFMPSMLQLLRRCNSTRKLSVLFRRYDGPWVYSCTPSCPCRLEESRNIGVILSSLEEVEITGLTDQKEELEFLEFLSHNAAILKKLAINWVRLFSPPPTKELREKIRSMYRPNVSVKFHV